MTCWTSRPTIQNLLVAIDVGRAGEERTSRSRGHDRRFRAVSETRWNSHRPLLSTAGQYNPVPLAARTLAALKAGPYSIPGISF